MISDMNLKIEKHLVIQSLILAAVFVLVYSHAIATLISDWVQ